MSQWSHSGGTDPVADALVVVLRDYGRRAASDPARLRAMLNDALGSVAGQHRASIDALVVSAEEGVSAAIAERGSVAGPAALTSLARWGLDPAAAAWVVATWTAALGGLAGAATAAPAAPVAATAAPSVPPVPVAAPAAPTAGPASGQPLALPLTTGRPRKAWVAGAVAAVLLVVAGTAYAISGGDSDVVGSPSLSPGPSGASTGPSGQPSSSASVSVEGTVLTTTGPTTVPTLTATRIATPTTPTRRPATSSRKTPPPPPPTPRVASNKSFSSRAIWNPATQQYDSTVWHTEISSFVTGSWKTLSVTGWTVTSATGAAESATGWATVQKYTATSIAWRPRHNARMIIRVHYRVVNSAGRGSNTGTLTISMGCDPKYVCEN